ncbi:phospholipase D-like domain-containing protein [Leptospira sp. 96542]|nr:phospholipase D-like domain-containing protein [Leptospira sp. 96542]
MKKIILLVYFFIQCQNPKKDDLFQLLSISQPVSQLYFSYPGRDVSEIDKQIVKSNLIKEIRKAEYSISAFLYSLDDFEILMELKLKEKSGVDIQLFGDKDEDYSESEELGFVWKRWRGSGIHHTKIWIIDDKTVFMGTGNYTTHGLDTDNNVFWKMEISQDEAKNLKEVLEEKTNKGVVHINGQSYYFAPELGLIIQDKILEVIQNAKFSIRYLIFTHYDPLISFYLLDASRRGVVVEGIYNFPVNPEGVYLNSNLYYPSKVYQDGNEDYTIKNGRFLGGLMHHKTMIVDDRIVITGSYNYSVSARDNNREVFVKWEHPNIVSEFLNEWARTKQVAKEFESNVSDTNLNEFTLVKFKNQLFQTDILLRANGSFDNNSSGLGNLYRKSLNISEIRSEPNLPRFVVKTEILDPIWEEGGQDFVGLKVTNLFFYTEIRSFSGELVNRITIWDGETPKESFESNELGKFPIGFGDQFKKDVWVSFQTNSGIFYSCFLKQKNTTPVWIQYLLAKLNDKNQNGFGCFSL